MIVDGVRWEVRVDGEGPALLLLHGFAGRGADWRPFLPALREIGRTIVVDLLGHGRSASPAEPRHHALGVQAAQLAAILQTLRASPAVVLGYSFGARVALQLALDQPAAARGLVLESPSAGISDPTERARRRSDDEALAARIERDGIEAFVDSWWATTPVFASERTLAPSVRARLRAARLRNRPAGLATSLRGAGQGATEPLHDRLATIRVPTLVIGGELDPIGAERAREVAALIPGARLEQIAGAGHAPHREAPARFRRVVLRQLQEVLAV